MITLRSCVNWTFEALVTALGFITFTGEANLVTVDLIDVGLITLWAAIACSINSHNLSFVITLVLTTE